MRKSKELKLNRRVEAKNKTDESKKKQETEPGEMKLKQGVKLKNPDKIKKKQETEDKNSSNEVKNKEHRSGVIKNKKDKPSTSWPDLDLGEEHFISDYEPEIPEPEPEQAALIPVAGPLLRDCVMQMVKQLRGWYPMIPWRQAC